MSEATRDAVILRDVSGGYYILTPRMLDAARATPEQAAAIERARAEDDTAGFSQGFFEAWTVTPSIVSPRDAASGLPTGKRPESPRDPATGQATGKRTHTPTSYPHYISAPLNR
jgi:hypothetical protein